MAPLREVPRIWHTGPRPPATEPSRQARPPWLFAAALYELGRHLDDDLALAVLDAAIALTDLWDVRVARAAVHLQLGNSEQAAADLDQALLGRDRVRSGIASLVVVSELHWDGVLRPVRSLLDPDLQVPTKLALWNAAVRGWNELECQHRLWPRTKESFRVADTSGAQRIFPDALQKELPRFLNAVAAAVPPRGPLGPLSASDFTAATDDQVPETLLAKGVVEQLHEKFGTPPSSPDESVGPRRSIREALAGSLQNWEESTTPAPSSTAGRSGSVLDQNPAVARLSPDRSEPRRR